MKKTFGAFINKKRIDTGISLRNFSKKIGISPEYLSKIENGLRAAPNIEIIEARLNVNSWGKPKKQNIWALCQ